MGYFLQHEAPVEYQLLKEVAEQMKFRYPSSELIEAICYASDDPLFKKPKFWRALMDYKKYGRKPPKAIKVTVEKELYHVRMRLRKLVN